MLSKLGAWQRRSPKHPPKQSAGRVWTSSPSQGLACRSQGENNCNDFRREPHLLQTCMKTMTQQSCFFLDFVMILACRRSLGASLRAGTNKNRQSAILLSTFSRPYFRQCCFLNRICVYFHWGVFLCFVLVSRLVHLRHRFQKKWGYFRVHVGVICAFFCRCC